MKRSHFQIEPQLLIDGSILPVSVYTNVAGVPQIVARAGNKIEISTLTHLDRNRFWIKAEDISAWASFLENNLGSSPIGIETREAFATALLCRLTILGDNPTISHHFERMKIYVAKLTSMSLVDLEGVMNTRTMTTAPRSLQMIVWCTVIVNYLAVNVFSSPEQNFSKDSVIWASLLMVLSDAVVDDPNGSAIRFDPFALMSILAIHAPVDPCTHNALMQCMEREDGSGTPFGLTTEQISAEGRCLAFCFWTAKRWPYQTYKLAQLRPLIRSFELEIQRLASSFIE